MTQLSEAGTAYDIEGPESAPVVVLIHGLGLTRQSTWTNFIPVLAKRYRVISYDLCGHGESALPPETPSLTVLAEQLRDLLDELGVMRCALLGFSLGGMINRRFAIDNPNRVTALAILNSPHERDANAQKLVEERAAQSDAGGPAATIDSTLKRWFTVEFIASNSSTVNQVRDVVLANEPGNYALHRIVLANGVTELIKPSPAITIPSLVMSCEFDSGSTPAMAQAIAAEIPGAQTVIVQGLQHLGLLEQPDLFSNELLRFLGNTLTPTEP